MTRMLTAAAIVALFAAPAFAQDVTGRSQGGSAIDQGSTTSDSMSSQSTTTEQYRSEQSTGLRPSDCLPNDVRPECQTASLPEEQTTPPEGQVGQTPQISPPSEPSGSLPERPLESIPGPGSLGSEPPSGGSSGPSGGQQ